MIPPRPRTLLGIVLQAVAIGACLIAAAYTAQVIVDLTSAGDPRNTLSR